MNRKMTWLVMVAVCIGMLALWGCPKKTEITAVPETPRQEKPQAEAAPPAVEPAAPAVAEVIAQPEKKVEAAKPAAEAVPERAAVVSAGLQPVYFDFNEALIEVGASKTMTANAEWLKAHPQVKVRIEGNCDERGTIEYNQALGQRRATIAKKYLTDMGISEERIMLISYGKEKLSCTDSSESCWQKNRRDDFTVVSEPMSGTLEMHAASR